MLGISFANSPEGFHNFSSFNQEVIELIRNNLLAEVLIVIDKAWGLPGTGIFSVTDHINLTGDNALVGQNDPCGLRFPKMTDLYISDDDTLQVITVGLKAEVTPNANELAALKEVGAQCWSYNLVPTSIIAAHAGLKVAGLLISDDEKSADLVRAKVSSLQT